MNIAELAINKRVITWVATVLLAVGGVISYQSLPRLEDPEFTIKDAKVITPYPGATAEEVEKEVTDVIEQACQQLGQLKRVRSESYRGMSVVTPTIKDKYDKNGLPQVWDELRRKVDDAQKSLPPGAGPSVINDDFGDVYGVFFAVTGDGYSIAEIREYCKYLKRELSLVKDVKRVILFGEQRETVYVEISRQKMARLGISPAQIAQALEDKNVATPAGFARLGPERIPINPTGQFQTVEEMGQLVISEPGAKRLIYLSDVAEIQRGYEDPPSKRLLIDGQEAVGVAISTAAGGNVVEMGGALEDRLQKLEQMRPVGMTLHPIALQYEAVTTSIRGFVINLVEAIMIVVVVLLIFMGLRSGLIIGAILFLTICGTFIVMDVYAITLERISLGALIIALGMLVDNGIVVTEGMLIRIGQGEDRLKAARDVVSQNQWPLLGATAIAVMAFGAIGLSQDSTGEYCRSLFTVLLISLGLSWITAVTITPLLCYTFLPGKPRDEGTGGKGEKDPYDNIVFKGYKTLLKGCIAAWPISIGLAVGLLALAAFTFQYIDKSFFPPSTRPQFLVDIWVPRGTHVEETERITRKIEEYLAAKYGLDGLVGEEGAQKKVDVPAAYGYDASRFDEKLEDPKSEVGRPITQIASFIGGGAARFLLTYAPETDSESYAQLLVSVDDYEKIDAIAEDLQTFMDHELPQVSGVVVVGAVKKFQLGPGEGGKIQFRVSGPELDQVNAYKRQIMEIMRSDKAAIGIRNDWYEPVKVETPVVSEQISQKTGIERGDVCLAMELASEGKQVGVFRDGDNLLPIVMRLPDKQRLGVDDLKNASVYSPVNRTMMPVRQVVLGFDTTWEEPSICRRNRNRTVTIHCDAKEGVPSVLLGRILPSVETQLKTKELKNFDRQKSRWLIGEDQPGDTEYYIEMGGEAESSADGQAGIAASLPLFLGLMVLIVIVLFASLRHTLVIWLVVPLAAIGISFGLFFSGLPFGFMALLGSLSLIGMLIKNCIVLVDQINIEIAAGEEPYDAVIKSGVSRMRPVAMAAATTILGMLPLLIDPFFNAMAITIMAGLFVATALTLLLLPVFYTVVFNVRKA